MQLLSDSERQFISALVDGTQKVLTSASTTKSEKLSTLQKGAAIHASYARRLRRAEKSCSTSEEKARVHRLVELREAAVRYLVSTARWLADQDQHGLSLRQRPRMFSAPTWSVTEPR